MGPQICITQDVVVHIGVLSWSEVPWLVLGVVFTLFEALELVLEVQDVVGLFISQRSILIFSENIGHSLIFHGGLSTFTGRLIV